jgi:uncharacterized membrane protein
MRIDAPAAAPAARLPVIDAWRGVAILAMIVYHFSWDLRHFGFITANVSSGLGWIAFARLIAGTFLFLVGVSLVLAMRGGIDWRRFSWRLAIVAAAALAVTVATYFIFPQTFVFFGILHHIAVASVLGLGFIRLPLALVAAAAVACFLAPHFLPAPIFTRPALLWIGLATEPVRSNDFVPIFPWFGVVLAGIFAARIALSPGLAGLRALLAKSPPRPLLFAGRHSLAIYLIHQPLLFGLVAAAAWIAPPAPPPLQTWFPEACRSECVAADLSAGVCAVACDCLAAEVEAAGLAEGIFRGTLSETETLQYYDLGGACRAAAEAR